MRDSLRVVDRVSKLPSDGTEDSLSTLLPASSGKVCHVGLKQTGKWNFRQRSRQQGTTLVELLIAIFLVVVALALTFEILVGFLYQQRRSLGQINAMRDGLRIYEILSEYLVEGVRGLSFRGQGGSIVMGRYGEQMVGPVWISPDGQRISFLQRTSGISPIPCLVAAGQGNQVKVIMTGINLPTSPPANPLWLAIIGWSPDMSAGAGLSPATAPFHDIRMGGVGRVMEWRLAVPDDVPSDHPFKAEIIPSIDWGQAVLANVEMGAIGELAPPVEVTTMVSQMSRLPEFSDVYMWAVPVQGVRQITCTPDRALVTRLNEETELELLPPQTLSDETRFFFIDQQMTFKPVQPQPSECFGVCLSGHYRPPEGTARLPFCLPFVLNDWINSPW